LLLRNLDDSIILPTAEEDSARIINGNTIQIGVDRILENCHRFIDNIEAENGRMFGETDDEHLPAGAIVDDAIRRLEQRTYDFLLALLPLS
jgi:hypothetical protein